MSVLRSTSRLVRRIPSSISGRNFWRIRGERLGSVSQVYSCPPFRATPAACSPCGATCAVNIARRISQPRWSGHIRHSFHSCCIRSQATGEASSGPALHGRLTDKDYDNIDVELVQGGIVGLIYLDRPKALNALSEALMVEVVDACQIFDNMDEVGAIVITGRGKAFAAGADIKEMKDKSFKEAHKAKLFSHWNDLSTIRKPIIAAVNGFALGGGCELAMSCDIILAGEKALFGQPEVKLGTIPGIGGTQRLIREIGKSRAMEMILTGKAFMNAEEAAQRGLVSRLVRGDNEALVAEAVDVARSIAELSRPTIALAKEAVNTAYEVGLSEGIKREHSLFVSTFALDDQKEGMAAFAEKRDPQFKHQ